MVKTTEITEKLREAVMDAVAGALGDAYDCTRTWSAWGVGTMSQDDFVLVGGDSERVAEIADAAIQAVIEHIDKQKTVGWQPIETAPKDGTAVLLFVETGRIRITGGYWDDHPKCQCWVVGGYMMKILPPKWWKPLPIPPQANLTGSNNDD